MRITKITFITKLTDDAHCFFTKTSLYVYDDTITHHDLFSFRHFIK